MPTDLRVLSCIDLSKVTMRRSTIFIYNLYHKESEGLGKVFFSFTCELGTFHDIDQQADVCNLSNRVLHNHKSYPFFYVPQQLNQVDEMIDENTDFELHLWFFLR
jgi:hypothetical protein